MAKETFENLMEQFAKSRQIMMRELGKVIIGQREVLDQLFASIIARGHCLLVGVPGLAKTMMVSALARIMELSFKRIQFTPDLMPTDITGTNVIDENEAGRREFRFVKGPIFAHIILADEINRTPPKTQAAMLQAMQEREVTVGQETYPLPDPFFVIATQNPIEQEGTYPLPEAQLDRFMFNIFVDYPTRAEEERILLETTSGKTTELERVFNGRQIVNMQKIVYSVPVSEYIIKYVAMLVRATRPKDATSPDFVKTMVDWGAGPRAGQYLIMGGKAVAAMDGRYTVSIEDIKKVAVPVLRHRIGCNFAASSEGVDSVEIVNRLLAAIPEPEVPKYISHKGHHDKDGHKSHHDKDDTKAHDKEEDIKLPAKDDGGDDDIPKARPEDPADIPPIPLADAHDESAGPQPASPPAGNWPVVPSDSDEVIILEIDPPPPRKG